MIQEESETHTSPKQ